MASSFVKDCSDVSAPGITNSGKTVIIIVNNETGNVSLDGDELQNLLASHGADGSQVSVVRMGSGGVGNLSEANVISSFATSDGTQHVNLTVEGYPAIPVEGQVGGGGNYAELPLDADAFQRLESVLESEEAREILGEPLLDMVTNPEQLGTLDELMDSSLFEGDPEDGAVTGDDVSTISGRSSAKITHSPPKRRSQRQMDKAEREEVEKILAENQKKLQEERQQLDEKQVLAKIQTLSTNSANKDEKREEEVEVEEDATEGKGKSKMVESPAAARGRGKDEKIEEESAPSLKGRGKGRGRGRGRGKVEVERENTQEMKGKGRGRKNAEVEFKLIQMEQGNNGVMGRGGLSDDTVNARGRGRGREKVRTVDSKEDLIMMKNVENDKNNSCNVALTGIKIEEVKESVEKMGVEEPLEKNVSVLKDDTVLPAPNDDSVSALNDIKNVIAFDNIKTVHIPNDKKKLSTFHENTNLSPHNDDKDLCTLNNEKNTNKTEEEYMRQLSFTEFEADMSNEINVAQEQESMGDPNRKKIKKPPLIPKIIPEFEPALFSTPDVMLKVGDAHPTQAIMVKGNGKSLKAKKILLVKKQFRKGTGQGGANVDDEKHKQNDEHFIQNVLTKHNNVDKPKNDVTNTAENIVLPLTSEANQVDKSVPVSTPQVSDPLNSDTGSNKSLETRALGSGVKPKVIQVKNPTGVRQVVVLNSAKAGMYRETLVKVIPPRDPPREDEKMSPTKQKTLLKKELHLQKKSNPQENENFIFAEGLMNENEKIKAAPKGDIHCKVPTQKKTDRTETQKSGDLHKTFEEVSLLKKKEEALRKKEEIQKKREELLRRREAIQKRKDMQKKENIQQKRDGEIDKKIDEHHKKSEKVVHKNNEPAMPRKAGEIQRSKTKEIPSSPTKYIHVTKKVNPQIPITPMEDSPVRRSNRAIKKKTFGDEMLTYDIKEELVPDEEEEGEPEEELDSEGDEDDESLEEYEDDDPERLWCICQKPHNNRFMICCDKCEDWFHGSCVGVTKAIGQQMEEEGKEWVCPKCKKAERAMKGFVPPAKKYFDISHTETSGKMVADSETSEVPKKTIVKKGVQGGITTDKHPDGEAVSKRFMEGSKKVEVQQTKLSLVKRGSLFQEIQPSPKKLLDEEKIDVPQIIQLSPNKSVVGGKEVQEVQNMAEAVNTLEKSEPRVLVYEKRTGKILSGAGAPTLGQLKDWLKEHSDFAVLQPGMMGSSGTVISTNSQLSSSNFYGQKKIIQLSPKSVAVPVSPAGHKVTVVKSADGRIIVKATETLDKVVSKPVSTLSMPAPTKSVVVSTTKPAILPTSPISKDGEGKKDTATFGKNDDSPSTKNVLVKEMKKLSDCAAVPNQNKPTSAEKKKPDPEEVRNNIRKTLADCLIKRYHDVKKEFDRLNEDDIKTLAAEIEKELYLFFGKDVGFKYKSRYRSILFNARDAKNSGLFRKILNGTISPSNLVRMTSEELASKELCEWREREEKKELLAIEKYELDMIALGNQYIMKSHKGEIEIDKDEFIKDKEKAPETLNSLPADPVTEVLEDTTLGHSNHIYDLSCKICTGKQDPSFVRQDLKSHKEKSQEKPRKDFKDKDPLKARKDRRKISSDKEKKERRDSADKERHKHKSKDNDKDRKSRDGKSRDKDKDRDKEREKTKSKDTNRDEQVSDKEKDKDKHRSAKGGDKEKYKNSSSSDKKKDKERRDSKDRRDDRDKKHKEKHRDRRDSKEERERRRKESERDERKRKHSESRSYDRKRKESEREFSMKRESANDEKQKEEVSTSEDVVLDFSRVGRHFSSCVDSDAKDAEPTSTVVGSPEVMDIKEYSSPYRAVGMVSPPLFHDSPPTPPLPPDSPEYIPPLPGDDTSMSIPFPDRPRTCLQQNDSDIPTASYPGEIPTTPPLPDEEIPSAPPLPDGEIPSTPPLPDDDVPHTPPLPDEEIPNTPPLPSEEVPTTPPLPMSRGSTTPPLPNEKLSSVTLPYSGSLLPPPPPSLSSGFISDLDRLTPPPIGVQKKDIASMPLPSVISSEPLNVWKGVIHMPDVAKFYASAFEVSGKAKFLPDDVPNSIEVVGRIAPDTVWSYIAQMKKSGSKEILVVRFQPANEEEKVSYIALYSYLSSKKRYAVIGNCEKSVKDFYVVPLASHQPIPQVLLPLDGPGFEEHRAHMLIGVIVRAKNKRVFDHVSGTWSLVSIGPTLPVQPVHKSLDISERSYTPPLPTDEDIQEIALAAKDSEDDETDDNEKSSCPQPSLVEESSIGFLDPGTLKRQARDTSENNQTKKCRINLLDHSSTAESSYINEEPSSPPEEIFVEASLDQESMLAELNRQIEEHKKELSEMQKTIGNEEEEPYSPSRAHSPPPPGGEQFKLDTSKINIPSNLQEILDNIRQKEAEIKQKEQEIKRRLSLTTDPIVMNYAKYQEFDREKSRDSIASTGKGDVDLRPLLQKCNKDNKTDIDLRVLKNTNKEKPSNEVDSTLNTDEDIDLRIRDPRLTRAQPAATLEAVEKGKTLSKMSDEELVAKALEMEDNGKSSGSSNKKSHSEIGAESLYQPVQPPFVQSSLTSGYMPHGGPLMLPDGITCSLGPSQPPGITGHTPYISSVGPQQPLELYGPQGGGLQGPTRHAGPLGPTDHSDPHDPLSHSSLHGPPDHSSTLGPLGHSGPHGPSGYSGPHGPPSHTGPHGPPNYSGPHGHVRPRYSDNVWEGGKNFSGRGWGHQYNKPRDRDRERDRERDWYNRTGRDRGRSKFQYMGRNRREGRNGGHERSRDNLYHERRERERDPPYDEHESGRDSPYPEIDY